MMKHVPRFIEKIDTAHEAYGRFNVTEMARIPDGWSYPIYVYVFLFLSPIHSSLVAEGSSFPHGYPRRPYRERYDEFRLRLGETFNWNETSMFLDDDVEWRDIDKSDLWYVRSAVFLLDVWMFREAPDSSLKWNAMVRAMERRIQRGDKILKDYRYEPNREYGALDPFRQFETMKRQGVTPMGLPLPYTERNEAYELHARNKRTDRDYYQSGTFTRRADDDPPEWMNTDGGYPEDNVRYDPQIANSYPAHSGYWYTLDLKLATGLPCFRTMMHDKKKLETWEKSANLLTLMWYDEHPKAEVDPVIMFRFPFSRNRVRLLGSFGWSFDQLRRVIDRITNLTLRKFVRDTYDTNLIIDGGSFKYVRKVSLPLSFEEGFCKNDVVFKEIMNFLCSAYVYDPKYKYDDTYMRRLYQSIDENSIRRYMKPKAAWLYSSEAVDSVTALEYFVIPLATRCALRLDERFMDGIKYGEWSETYAAYRAVGDILPIMHHGAYAVRDKPMMDLAKRIESYVMRGTGAFAFVENQILVRYKDYTSRAFEIAKASFGSNPTYRLGSFMKWLATFVCQNYTCKDVRGAMERAYALRDTFDIACANMTHEAEAYVCVRTGQYSSFCPNKEYDTGWMGNTKFGILLLDFLDFRATWKSFFGQSAIANDARDKSFDNGVSIDERIMIVAISEVGLRYYKRSFEKFKKRGVIFSMDERRSFDYFLDTCDM